MIVCQLQEHNDEWLIGDNRIVNAIAEDGGFGMQPHWGKLALNVRLIFVVLVTLALTGCKPAVVFDADKLAIHKGEKVTLSWSVTPAGQTVIASVTITPGPGTVDATGSTVVTPQATTTYHLTATAIDGNNKPFVTEKDVTITVDSTGPLCSADDAAGLPVADGEFATQKMGGFIPLCNGQVYIGNQTTNQLELRNVFTGALVKSYQLPNAPGDLELDEANGLLYVAMPPSTYLAKINLATDQVDIIQIPAAAYHLSIAGDGRLYMATGADYSKKLYVLNTDGTTLGGWTLNGSFIRYVSQTGQLIVGGEGLSPSSLSRYGFDAGGVPQLLEYLWDAGSNGEGLAVSADGKHLAFPNGGGNGAGYSVYDFDPSNLQNVFGDWKTGPYPYGAAFSLDSQYLAATNYDTLLVFNVASHTEVKRSSIAKCSYGQLSRTGISRGGKYAFVKESCDFNGSTGKIHFTYIGQ